MNSTELSKPPSPPSVGNLRNTAPNTSPSDSELPTVGEVADEILPLVGVVAVAGPPVVLLAGGWVLFALMLTGPFLLLVTFALVAVILVAISAAIIAPPYLLIRHLRRRWTRRPNWHPLVYRLPERRPTGFRLLSKRSDASP